MVSCFLNIGSVKATKNYTNPIVETEENQANVWVCFYAHLRSWILAGFDELGISPMSIHRL